MYYTTGLTREQILDLCTDIRSATTDQKSPWPPILGMYKSVVVALTYMRRNRVQAELAETYGVSQSTISRAITGLTPLIGKALEGYIPTAEDLDRDTQYIVDGTLCFPAGHGPRPNCTPASTRPPE
jgi:Helix-turn-helix of DDE superfamily endonuclease